MHIADEVRRLEEENIELKAESEHRKNLLIDQHANFKVAIAKRDSLLAAAASDMNEAEAELMRKEEVIKELSARLARFELVRDVLNDARYGVSPIEEDRRQASFFHQNLPIKVN